MEPDEVIISKLNALIEEARKDKRKLHEKMAWRILDIRFIHTNEKARKNIIIDKGDQVRFKVYNPVKYILTFGIPLTIIPLLIYFSNQRVLQHPLFLGVIIFAFFYFPLMFYQWRSPEFNKMLVLSEKGIFFEGYWYEWKNILRTYIREIDIPDRSGRKTITNLTLCMRNFTLINIDSFKYKVTEGELCCYIEYYFTKYKNERRNS